jgi:hypothetical protein
MGHPALVGLRCTGAGWSGRTVASRSFGPNPGQTTPMALGFNCRISVHPVRATVESGHGRVGTRLCRRSRPPPLLLETHPGCPIGLFCGYFGIPPAGAASVVDWLPSADEMIRQLMAFWLKVGYVERGERKRDTRCSPLATREWRGTSPFPCASGLRVCPRADRSLASCNM